MAEIRGSIAGSLMRVTHIFVGSVRVGEWVIGVGIEDGTRITGQSMGAQGSVGYYTVAPAQTVPDVAISTESTHTTKRKSKVFDVGHDL